MATTTNRAYPYPAPTDAPDGPGAIFTLATEIDARLGTGGAESAANLTAINAIPTARCFDGKLAYAVDTQYLWRYTVPASGSPFWAIWSTPWVPFAGTRGTPAYPTGFVTPGFGYPPAWRVNGGDVLLSGVAQKTAGTAFAPGDNLFSVPALVTPAAVAYQIVNGSAATMASLQVQTGTGQISVHSVKGTAPTWLTLDGWGYRLR